MKIVKWVLLALLVLIVVGAAVLYFSLNSIVRSTVEKQSAASLNVPTKLGGASVSLFGGKVGLSDFNVASPAGFGTERPMLSLGGLDVGVKLSELNDDPVKVRDIQITKPRLVIEMKGTKFNIKEFVDALPAGDPAPQGEAEPLKLIIDHLRVQGAEVVFKPDVSAVSSIPGIGEALKGLQQEYVLPIPDIDLTKIGTAEGNQNGVAIKEVTTQVITAMAEAASKSEMLPPELRGLLSGNVDAIKDRLVTEAKRQIEKVGEQVQKEVGEKLGGEAGKVVGDVLKDPEALKKDPGKAVQEGLKGILGGKKDDAPPATQPK
ncbi:MAG: AsmA family protein [Tepidisphaeraceae bacterium]